MNKTNVILGIAAFAFGGLTLHFGKQIYNQQKLSAETPASESVPAKPEPAAVAAKPVSAVPDKAAPAPESPRTPLDSAIELNRPKLAGLKRRLNLAPELWEKLLSILTAQDLETRDLAARCKLDPACKSSTPDANTLANRAKAIQDVVGEDVAAQITQYNNTLNERTMANELQRRLGPAPLTATGLDDFVEAIADENSQTRQAIVAAGGQSTSFSLKGHGKVFYPAGDSPLEERIDLATRNSQRLRDRAATLLSPEQLPAFNEMQEELLAAFRDFLEAEAGKPAP